MRRIQWQSTLCLPSAVRKAHIRTCAIAYSTCFFRSRRNHRAESVSGRNASQSPFHPLDISHIAPLSDFSLGSSVRPAGVQKRGQDVRGTACASRAQHMGVVDRPLSGFLSASPHRQSPFVPTPSSHAHTSELIWTARQDSRMFVGNVSPRNVAGSPLHRNSGVHVLRKSFTTLRFDVV